MYVLQVAASPCYVDDIHSHCYRQQCCILLITMSLYRIASFFLQFCECTLKLFLVFGCQGLPCWECPCSCCSGESYFKKVFFCLFEKQKSDSIDKEERDPPSLGLLLSQPKLETRNSSWSIPMWMAGTQVQQAVIHCFPGHLNKVLDREQNNQDSNWYLFMKCQCDNGLTHCTTTVTPEFFLVIITRWLADDPVTNDKQKQKAQQFTYCRVMCDMRA